MDKDIELQKLQAFESYFRTKINILYSLLISFIVGFLLLIMTLYYQGTFNFFPYETYGLGGTLVNVAIFIALLLGASAFMKKYYLDKVNDMNDECLNLVEELIAQVEKGETLPSMAELKKKAKII
jgi:uncharacterized membrane protein affecting hemolysin expression